MLKIVGSYISPYVRKVLVCLDLKNIEYQIDPIVPFFGNDRFNEISPVRRIPVLVDGDIVIPDSTVICEYLEEKYRSPSLYPTDPVTRSKVRWQEEYADSRMGEVFIWRYFNELVIRPFVWSEKTDADTVSKAVTQEIPQILDYLEGIIPERGYIFGMLSVADISIASFFRNLFLANFKLNRDQWPAVGRFVQEIHNLPCFEKLKPFEELSTRTPIKFHRQALLEAGAPVSKETYFGGTPKKGVLKT